MSASVLEVSRSIWELTWSGLAKRGAGVRESACVWLGHRDGGVERAADVVFLDDHPETVAHAAHHRAARGAVAAAFARARERGLVVVCDIHTHPNAWVGLSEVDRAHPIEYRVGLVALVLPGYATGPRRLSLVGVHEYLGDGMWATVAPARSATRVRIDDAHGGG